MYRLHIHIIHIHTRHHAHGVEGGDDVGGGAVEVGVEDHGQLEEHRVVHLYTYVYVYISVYTQIYMCIED